MQPYRRTIESHWSAFLSFECGECERTMHLSQTNHRHLLSFRPLGSNTSDTPRRTFESWQDSMKTSLRRIRISAAQNADGHSVHGRSIYSERKSYQRFHVEELSISAHRLGALSACMDDVSLGGAAGLLHAHSPRAQMPVPFACKHDHN